MKGNEISISEIINRGKREGIITQGLIAWWLNKGGTTPYLIFKQIKELCELGILDDDDYICMVYKNRVVFRPAKESSGEINILTATPSGVEG